MNYLSYLLLGFMSAYNQDNIQQEAYECQPACRGSFICVDGACVSPCGRPCGADEVCTESGECVPQLSKEPEPPTSTTERRYESAVISSAALDVAIQEEEKRRREAQIPHYAVLMNPIALASTYPLYGFFMIPLNIQIAGSYVGLDILGTVIVGGFVGGAGEIGLRILPFGKGLRGFYIVPRFGGGYPVGFMVTGETGYAWVIKYFAINLGGGCGWASEVGVLPFGNLSLGIAF